MLQMRIDAAAERRTFFMSLAPNLWAVMTVKPEVKPMVKPISKKNNGPVDPTAAKEFTPKRRPTIIVSEMLYIC